MKLVVEGMTCGHCVRSITNAIQALDPSAKVHVDLEEAEVSIDGMLDIASAVVAIREAGYEVVTILEAGGSADRVRESKTCCSTRHS